MKNNIGRFVSMVRKMELRDRQDVYHTLGQFVYVTLGDPRDCKTILKLARSFNIKYLQINIRFV